MIIYSFRDDSLWFRVVSCIYPLTSRICGSARILWDALSFPWLCACTDLLVSWTVYALWLISVSEFRMKRSLKNDRFTWCKMYTFVYKRFRNKDVTRSVLAFRYQYSSRPFEWTERFLSWICIMVQVSWILGINVIIKFFLPAINLVTCAMISSM